MSSSEGSTLHESSANEQSVVSESGVTESEQILDVGALFAEDETDASDAGEGVIVGELEMDVGNLLVFDRQEQPKNASPAEQAQRCVQELFEHVFKLPTTQSEAGPVAALPEPVTQIPREKPLPKERAPTRWEKFAKDKGIKKRKRERVIYDEATREYKARYGSNRAGSLNDKLVMDHKPEELERYGAEDPFILEKMKKKQRVQKQKKQELVNRRRAASEDTKHLPATVDITTNAPRKQKQSIERAIALAQKSTASIGRFDKRHEDEPVIKRKPKHAPVALEDERKQSLKMVERVLKKTAAETLDVDRAATLAIRDDERKKAAKNREDGKKRKFNPGKGKGGPAKKKKTVL